MTYVSESGFEQQQEQLKGQIRGQKLEQLRHKLRAETFKTQAENSKQQAEGIKAQAAAELIPQANHQLQASRYQTQIEGIKSQIIQNDLDVISKELPIRKQIGAAYLQGLEADLKLTQEQSRAKQEAVKQFSERIQTQLAA